jgi:4-carboxymuconolactone decarboxylase
MRLQPLAPDSLTPELRHVHDEVVALMARTQPRVVSTDQSGALVGPFPVMLHFPRFGIPALTFQRAVSSDPRLSKTVREVAILTVGAAFDARYELYAHEITAAEVGLSSDQIATLAAGERPTTLSAEESIAHDIARVLATGRIVPASAFARAVELLGHDGVGELMFLISGYGMLAMLLNAFDVPVPDSDG